MSFSACVEKPAKAPTLTNKKDNETLFVNYQTVISIT